VLGSSRLIGLLNERGVSGWRRPGVVPAAARIAIGLAFVALATALLVATGADLPIAASVLLLVVVCASVLGYAPGIAAAVMAFGALNYYFTEPLHTFAVHSTSDVVALVVFIVIAVIVGTAFAWLNDLRLRAQRAEHDALLRLSFIDRLAAGAEPATVLQWAVVELVALFDLARGQITSAGIRYRALGARAETETRSFAHGDDFCLEVGLGHTVPPGELRALDALGASLATTLERIRLDADAREQEILHQLDRSRAGFLTAVTHDLRTPLATIKAGTHALLLDDPRLSVDERRKVAEVAHDESARLERIITNVLELTRVRGGALRPEPIAVDAADLVGAAVRRLDRLTERRTITVDFDPELPPLWGDPAMLEHVIVNLLENALRYSPAASPVEIAATTSADGRQAVRVVDHGTGVGVDDRERMFEEFVRLEPARPPSGTGLGLAIVRAFVDANGGQVGYEETPGGGATFVVTLDVADREERP